VCVSHNDRATDADARALPLPRPPSAHLRAQLLELGQCTGHGKLFAKPQHLQLECLPPTHTHTIACCVNPLQQQHKA